MLDAPDESLDSTPKLKIEYMVTKLNLNFKKRKIISLDPIPCEFLSPPPIKASDTKSRGLQQQDPHKEGKINFSYKII